MSKSKGKKIMSAAHRLSLMLATGVCLVATGQAWGLDKMVDAVNAKPSDLAETGLGVVTGAGVTVGVIEAGQNVPNMANLFLAPVGYLAIPQGARPVDSIGNHATNVTGVVVSQGPTFVGIAPGAGIEAAGIGISSEFILNSQDAIDTAVGSATPIVNMSLGFAQALGTNNGSLIGSLWMDWAARSAPLATIEDVLFIVAGNETGNEYGSPSDAFNNINVGATGRRVGGKLVYDQGASYNKSNTTSDVSPITNLGRQKTDIVAPGGDPGPLGAAGTFNAVPAGVNQFVTTGGGVWEYAGTNAGNPIYDKDDFNGGGLTDDAMLAIDDTAPVIPGPPFPVTNPGANLGGGDTLRPNTIAGTSFAAPLVAGAAALLYEGGTTLGMSTDHKVLKAVLLNGADKNAPTGAPLTDQNNAVWGRALNAGTFTKVDPLTVTGPTVDIQVGLDPLLGTGQMDVKKSAMNYAAGEQGPGLVRPVGWDIATLGSNVINHYSLDNVMGLFTATLTWDRFVTLNEVVGAPDGLWNTEDTNTNGILDAGEDLNANLILDADTFNATALRDLDLELWDMGTMTRVSLSTSDIDNVEHIYVPNLPLGNYRLDVLNRSNATETYGLAWFIPEPASAALLALGAIATLSRRIHRGL